MRKITLDTIKGDIASIFNRVLDDQEPISIAVENGREVVVIDADDYAGIMETLHLLGSEANANRLLEGIQQHKRGHAREIDVTTYLD